MAKICACSAGISVALLLGMGGGAAWAAPSPADPNLLSELAAIPADVGVSSFYNADYATPNLTNGLAGGPGVGEDFVFSPSDSDQRVAITGFGTTPVGLVRIFFGDLQPKSIVIRSSSTSETSIAASDYETALLSQPIVNLSTVPGGANYEDFSISAPAGTQSLFFDFGAGNYTSGDAGFARIGELQAFTTPEPAAGLTGLAGVALLALRRRRGSIV